MKVLVDLPVILSDERRASTDSPQLVLSSIPDEPLAYVSLAPDLLILTFSPDLELSDLAEGVIVDVSVDWFPKPEEVWSDDVHLPYVLPENAGKRHSKLAVQQVVVAGGQWDKKLSEIISGAPRADRPGGYRGTQGRKKEHKKQVGLRLDPRQLETFYRLGGQDHIYEYLDQQATESESQE